MKFECQHCGQHIEAGSDWAGLSTVCPLCGENITVPDVAEDLIDFEPELYSDLQTDALPNTELAAAKAPVQYDVFLSYRRGRGAEIAYLIKDRLESHGFRVFLDVQCLREGDWMAALEHQISACTDFIPIITEGFFDNCSEPDDAVRHEIEVALAKEKNIVPLLVAESPFPADLPPSLGLIPSYQGVDYSKAYINESLTKLIDLMKADRFGIDRLATGEILPKVVVFVVAIFFTLMYGGRANHGGLAGFLITPFFALLMSFVVCGPLFSAALLFKVNPNRIFCGREWLIFWIFFIPIITVLGMVSAAGTGILLSFMFEQNSNVISFVCLITSIAVAITFTYNVISLQLWRRVLKITPS